MKLCVSLTCTLIMSMACSVGIVSEELAPVRLKSGMVFGRSVAA